MGILTQGEVVEKNVSEDKITDISFRKKPVYDFFKRIFDIVASFAALIVLSPVFLITAVVIMFDDFGNPFFIQERIGYNGEKFKMIKFRTMYKDAEERKKDLLAHNEADGVHFKMKDDPRILPHARFIRKTSIDELPQLINIFFGKMTIIGPRPFVVNEQEQLPDDRLLVKPGLSCYWQLADRDSMPINEQLELDYKYIRERSFRTDFKIILKTIALIFNMGNH